MEPYIPVLARETAARDLAHRRRERIREVQLEDVPAEALLYRERSVVCARIETGDARREFADHIDARADPDAGAKADDERVVVVGQLRRNRVAVVHPDRFEIHRRDVLEALRDDDADPW